jgi:phage terminase large subunit-like protein
VGSSKPDDYVARGLHYAEQVVSGEIPACKWVRLACQRQIDDLARKDWQWTFDRGKANRICAMAELMPHVKGRWKSALIQLEPHQCFRLTTIFGWVGPEGYRRFRKALIVLPRKNAKTTEAAIVGNYMLAMDGEPGAEVYAGAVTRDQVTGPSGVWTIAHKMATRCQGFRDHYGVEAMAHSIVVESTGSSFKATSREAGAQEGFNTHCAIIDELHAHTTREVFDVLDESTGARKQPLLYIISTEGDNATGVFAEQVSYAQQILSGTHQDDSYFGIIYTIDAEDDWTDSASWYKANPNLGVSVFIEDLEIRCRQAQKNAESQSSFLTKRLNVRVGAGEAYFNMLAWGSICKDPTLRIEDFYGQSCWITVDLASKNDFAATMRTFERDGILYLFPRLYLPESRLERGHANYDFYRGWLNGGHFTATPGDVIDFDMIERDVLEDARNFDVLLVGVDPYNATHMTNFLEKENVNRAEISQGVLSLNDATKELWARIQSGTVRHDGNPVLTWMVGNAVAKPDKNENVKIFKARNDNKIDGAVAAVMGCKLAMMAKDETISYTGLRSVAC